MAALGEKNGASVQRNSRKRSNLWTCGTCSVMWTECKCSESMQSQSISSILKSCKGLSKDHLQHMNVFIYFSYRRWSSPYSERNFTAAVFPPFEGWYPAWIQPKDGKAVNLPGYEKAVLQVLVRFQDGTSMEGVITRGGELIVSNRASTPRLGVFVDADVAKTQADVMPVARMLTMEEIRSGARGMVHGSVIGQNNGRKVSHIVADNGDGGYRVMTYPRGGYDAVNVVTLPQRRVKEFVPQYVEEFKLRHKRRFTKAVARSIHPYLESFFERARAADIQQRAARSPAVDRPSADALLKDAVKNLEVLNEVMRASGHADGEGHSAGRRS